MSLLVVVVQSLSCLGLGTGVIRVLKAGSDLDDLTHWTLAFAIGFGVLGWLVFILGVGGAISPVPLMVLLGAGLALVVLLPRPGIPSREGAMGPVRCGLVGLLVLVLIFDVLEGVAPPVDADSLAYHFAIPRQFVEAGRIFFVPQPIDGAVPLLVQMTYVPALALGGERAMTMWTMASGWSAAALLFALCRPHLDFDWSLAVALVFLTTPAVIYGGGSGQVEARIALFVMLGAWSTARAIETGQARYVILAALGAGLYVAAKYTGLLFAAVIGGAMMFSRRRFYFGLLFAVTAVAAGSQWYAWNALHTGDPVFPMLFQWLGRDDLWIWNREHDLFFKELYFAIESPLPKNLLWLILFPFKATFFAVGLPESVRIGLGVFGFLALPFAVLGAWHHRERIRQSRLFAYGTIAIVFYLLWFFFGGSIRTRHLVPILPLLLACVAVASERWTRHRTLRKQLIACVAAVLVIQAGGHGVFALNYLKFLTTGSDREAFLGRNVEPYVAVDWLNANLGQSDRVLFVHRQLRYFLDVPNVFGSELYLAAVDMRPGRADAATAHRQLQRLGITYVVLDRWEDGTSPYYQAPFDVLRRAGCLAPVKSFDMPRFTSRTLPTMNFRLQKLDIVGLENEDCLR